MANMAWQQPVLQIATSRGRMGAASMGAPPPTVHGAASVGAPPPAVHVSAAPTTGPRRYSPAPVQRLGTLTPPPANVLRAGTPEPLRSSASSRAAGLLMPKQSVGAPMEAKVISRTCSSISLRSNPSSPRSTSAGRYVLAPELEFMVPLHAMEQSAPLHAMEPTIISAVRPREERQASAPSSPKRITRASAPSSPGRVHRARVLNERSRVLNERPRVFNERSSGAPPPSAAKGALKVRKRSRSADPRPDVTAYIGGADLAGHVGRLVHEAVARDSERSMEQDGVIRRHTDDRHVSSRSNSVRRSRSESSEARSVSGNVAHQANGTIGRPFEPFYRVRRMESGTLQPGGSVSTSVGVMSSFGVSRCSSGASLSGIVRPNLDGVTIVTADSLDEPALAVTQRELRAEAAKLCAANTSTSSGIRWEWQQGMWVPVPRRMRSTGGSHIKKEQANGERHDAAASSAAGSESLHVRLFMEHEDRRERQKKREEADQLRKCPSRPDISKSQASGPVVRCESYGGASEITIPPEAKGTITPPQQGTITPPPDPVELREVPSAPIAAPAPASESSTAKRASDRFNNLYKDNEMRQRRWLARHEAKCRQEEETLRKQRGRTKGTRTFDKGSFHDWYERNAKRYFEAERSRQAQQELREQERIAEELAACRFNTQATFEKSTGGSSIGSLSADSLMRGQMVENLVAAQAAQLETLRKIDAREIRQRDDMQKEVVEGLRIALEDNASFVGRFIADGEGREMLDQRISAYLELNENMDEITAAAEARADLTRASEERLCREAAVMLRRQLRNDAQRTQLVKLQVVHQLIHLQKRYEDLLATANVSKRLLQGFDADLVSRIKQEAWYCAARDSAERILAEGEGEGETKVDGEATAESTAGVIRRPSSAPASPRAQSVQRSLSPHHHRPPSPLIVREVTQPTTLIPEKHTFFRQSSQPNGAGLLPEG